MKKKPKQLKEAKATREDSSNTEKPEQLEEDEEPKMPEDRFQFITVDCRRAAIPVAPPFQADVPSWTDPPDKEQFKSSYRSDSSKWLGTLVWPHTQTEKEKIGAGRPDLCGCTAHGSIECVRMHISDKRIKLKSELGPAFWIWQFDGMGEEVSDTWNKKEQDQFKSIVKRNPISQGKSFLKPAMEKFKTQTRQTIVNYYFNVYLLRRMSSQIRSGSNMVDTDDEEGDDESPSKRRRKSKPLNRVTTYLGGCR